MFAVYVVFFSIIIVIAVLGKLTYHGKIPYRFGGIFWELLDWLPAIFFFGGIILTIANIFFGPDNGTDGCFIDWDGRSNPLAC